MTLNRLNVENRTLFVGDNLHVLQGVNSKSVDLIYLDPPFNKGYDFGAPIGSRAAGVFFKDMWTMDDLKAEELSLMERGDYRGAPAIVAVIEAAGLAHDKSMKAYLIMMALRLLQMRRILKDTGSIYLHCDTTAGSWLKALMDAIFGAAMFKNEIVWKRSSGTQGGNQFNRVHDRILFYAGKGATWNQIRDDYDPEYIEKNYKKEDEHGMFRISDLTAPHISGGDAGQPWRGYDPGKMGRGRQWLASGQIPDWAKTQLPEGYWDFPVRQKLDILDDLGLIYWPPTKGAIPGFKTYLETTLGVRARDIITHIPPVSSRSRQNVSYLTQKPIRLLERLIEAASNPGDLVLDPFCGCATACVAAEKLDRQWIGIDLSPKAHELVLGRLAREVAVEENGKVRQDDSQIPLWDRRVTLRTEGEYPILDEEGRKRSPNIKDILYGEQSGDCAGCSEHFHKRNFTIDHIVPTNRGGQDIDENLQLLCGQCNSEKGTSSMADFMAKMRAKQSRLR